MKKITILIVDDEALGRDRIRGFLADEEDVEIVGECKNGEQALEAIRSKRPDVVFLDVQMPVMDGFEVVRELDSDGTPIVIFVTAHDEHAIAAFEVNAFDYLLKPFRKERFMETLDRARQFLQKQRVVDLQEELLSMLTNGGGKPAYLNRLTVKTANSIIFVKVEEVDWLESAGNYVEIHTGSKTYTIRETMNALEEKLAPERFLRISRSHIVNLGAIEELKPLFKGEYSVVLRGGTQLTLNRGLKELQKRLEVL